jgi:GH15 family glucan-1,4-alpha-glucosidase
VRVGNLAHRQLQIDVYGEILDMFHVCRRVGIPETADAWALQQSLMDFLETGWERVDSGIWEVRGPERHFTHSKVMAWAGVDRTVRAVEEFGLETDKLDRWKQLRETIHSETCRRAYDPERKAFMQYFGADTIDASLLQIPMVGFLPATDPRVIGTVKAIERELKHGDFIRRYSLAPHIDGLPDSEGAFLPCTFWLADNYALQGRIEEGRALFERLLDVSNDVGLLSEEYDPVDKRQLGNFPQAYSHVSLVNTARNLIPSGPAIHRMRSTMTQRSARPD